MFIDSRYAKAELYARFEAQSETNTPKCEYRLDLASKH
jgi:hypothetical protein